MRGMEASHQSLGYSVKGSKVSDLQTDPSHKLCHAHPASLDNDQIRGFIIAFINEFFSLGNRLERIK